MKFRIKGLNTEQDREAAWNHIKAMYEVDPGSFTEAEKRIIDSAREDPAYIDIAIGMYYQKCNTEPKERSLFP
jgi:hypothetical protein